VNGRQQTTAPEVPEGSIEIRIEDLTVMRLEPRDVILLHLPPSALPHLQRVREMIMQRIPGHEVIVTTTDCEFAVLRPPHIETGAEAGRVGSADG
jgi:hypothetical protein